MFFYTFGKKFIPKVEFIFNNYDDFDAWYKCFQSIVKLNSPDKEKNKKFKIKKRVFENIAFFCFIN